MATKTYDPSVPLGKLSVDIHHGGLMKPKFTVNSRGAVWMNI